MKAVTLQALNQVELRDLPIPVPAADQLLVQMAATTVCTSDLQDIARNSFCTPLPMTIGH